MPLVTTITPCFNAGRYLRPTLESILAQSLTDWESIVVDDGSTDDSAVVVRSFGDRITLIQQENRGESAARNVGLRAATGDYVMFLDADDLLAPQALELLSAAVQRIPGAVGLMGVAYFDSDPSLPLGNDLPHHTSFFPTILRTNFPIHCWFTPRELALSVGGFREDLVNSEDWEFWARIALTGSHLVTVPYAGALYRQHAQSQVATTPKPAIFRGRLLVAETLARGLLDLPELLEETGEALFWSLWAMLRQARRGGVDEQQLRSAELLLREVARRGPRALRNSLSARAVRYLGVRTTERLQRVALSIEQQA